MLSKQEQIRYLETELEALVTFLTEFNALKPDKKEIHDLRISIKKIKALTEVNRIRGYEAGTLAQVGISELFRTTGLIRNSQVILSSLEKAGIHEKKISRHHHESIQRIAAMLASETPRFLKNVNDFRIETISGKLKSISEKQLLDYHKLKLGYLAKVFRTPLDPYSLHEGRKHIKHLLYIREMISPSTLKKIPYHYNNLDEMQNLIGKWHDSVIFLDFLREIGFDKKKNLSKEFTKKTHEQFENINLFLLDKKKKIFISRS